MEQTSLAQRRRCGYYAANKSSFTTDCVSRIVTSSQSAAQQIVGELNAGASFATLAKSISIDTQTASNGGSLGCTFTEATVDLDSQQQNISGGQSVGNRYRETERWIGSSTKWRVRPWSRSPQLCRLSERELLQSTSNVNRVTAEIIAFAHRSDVSVDPEYGTWSRLSERAAGGASFPVPAFHQHRVATWCLESAAGGGGTEPTVIGGRQGTAHRCGRTGAGGS